MYINFLKFIVFYDRVVCRIHKYSLKSMKTLLIVRHAKSGWDNPDLNDFERPLNKRGHRDAPFMGDLIAKMGIKPDLIISSSALRAHTTAGYFADSFKYPKDKIIADRSIYERGIRHIIKLIKNLDNNISTVMVFGHNPDITSLSSFYSGEYFDNVPTCGVVCIDFNVTSWNDTDTENGKLRFYEFPKKHLPKI